MITSIDPLDISLERWLEYAFLAIPNFIFTAAIIILVTFLVFYGVAVGWGLLWNKKWTIGKNKRWLMVFVLAAITAACLAARDSLCNGELGSFFGEADKVSIVFTGEPINKLDSKSAYEVAKKFTKLFSDKEALAALEDDIDGSDPASGDAPGSAEDSRKGSRYEWGGEGKHVGRSGGASDSAESNGLPDDSQDEGIKYAVLESSIGSYEACYGILTYVSLFCFLLVLIIVPWLSYQDIKLIAPVTRETEN